MPDWDAKRWAEVALVVVVVVVLGYFVLTRKETKHTNNVARIVHDQLGERVSSCSTVIVSKYICTSRGDGKQHCYLFDMQLDDAQSVVEGGMYLSDYKVSQDPYGGPGFAC